VARRLNVGNQDKHLNGDISDGIEDVVDNQSIEYKELHQEQQSLPSL
jgi:hypothetical protein